jgi:hypothetical protein
MLIDKETFLKEIRTTYKEINKNSIETYCPNGWVNICLEALVVLEDMRQNGKDICIRQIKEKFAEFRFYLHGKDSDEAEILISKILKKAKTTCMVCGKKGKAITRGGWIKVRCKTHEK